MNLQISPVAHIESIFPDKFGIPRQSGLAEDIEARIVFEKPFRNMDALRGLTGFSYLWLIWGFSENPLITEKNWSPTVRPPRLGGNKKVGVFATRSSFRPNGLALSSVRIKEIRQDSKLGPVIIVSGADLMNGTPIYDIKPYISTDCHPDAVCGFQEETKDYRLKVNFSPQPLSVIPAPLQKGLLEVLSQDPRPSYQNDSQRIYGIRFAGFDVRFQVADDILTVIEICRFQHN